MFCYFLFVLLFVNSFSFHRKQKMSSVNYFISVATACRVGSTEPVVMGITLLDYALSMTPVVYECSSPFPASEIRTDVGFDAVSARGGPPFPDMMQEIFKAMRERASIVGTTDVVLVADRAAEVFGHIMRSMMKHKVNLPTGINISVYDTNSAYTTLGRSLPPGMTWARLHDMVCMTSRWKEIMKESKYINWTDRPSFAFDRVHMAFEHAARPGYHAHVAAAVAVEGETKSSRDSKLIGIGTSLSHITCLVIPITTPLNVADLLAVMPATSTERVRFEKGILTLMGNAFTDRCIPLRNIKGTYIIDWEVFGDALSREIIVSSCGQYTNDRLLTNHTASRVSKAWDDGGIPLSYDTPQKLMELPPVDGVIAVHDARQVNLGIFRDLFNVEDSQRIDPSWNFVFENPLVLSEIDKTDLKTMGDLRNKYKKYGRRGFETYGFESIVVNALADIVLRSSPPLLSTLTI